MPARREHANLIRGWNIVPVAILIVLATMWAPFGSAVSGDDGAGSPDPIEQPAPPTDTPPPPPSPTPEPTPVSPTIAPTAEPTSVPTEAPTAEPAVVPTSEPTTIPMAEPTVEPASEPVDPDTLDCQPVGATPVYLGASITYDCTLTAGSDRTGTRIVASLVAPSGWTVQLAYIDNAGNTVETEPGPEAETTLSIGLVAGSTARFTATLHAPVDASSEQTVTARIETGIATADVPLPALDGPHAVLGATVIPWPPNTLACETWDGMEMVAGNAIDTACTYTVNGPATGLDLTAAFASVPGAGWELSIERASGGDPLLSERGNSTTWNFAESLAPGATVSLTIRMYAPVDAVPGTRAAVELTTSGITGPAAGWSVTVAESPAFGMLTIVDPGAGGGLSCAAASPGPRLAGSEVTYTCTWDSGLLSLAGTVNAAIVNAPPTSGWAISFGDEEGGIIVTLTEFVVGLLGKVEFNVYVDIPDTAAPGETAVTTVTATCSPVDLLNLCTDGAVTIETKVDQVVGQTDEAALTCDPVDGYSIDLGVDESLTFDCSLWSLVDSTEVGVHFDSLSVSVPPGWGVTASPLADDVPSTPFEFEPNPPAFVVEGTPFEFDLLITPTGSCEPSDETVALVAGIAIGPAAPSLEANQSLELDIPLTITGNPAVASATFSGGPFTFGSATYGEAIDATDAIGLVVTPPECPALVTPVVSMGITSAHGTQFDFDGEGEGGMPLSVVTLTRSVSADVEAVAPNSPVSPVPIAGGVDIASIESTGGEGVSVDLTLAIDIPAEQNTAKPGTHSATLIVTISSDPED